MSEQLLDRVDHTGWGRTGAMIGGRQKDKDKLGVICELRKIEEGRNYEGDKTDERKVVCEWKSVEIRVE